MKLQVYTVFDSKVKACLQPMFFRADGEAMRAFEEAVNTPNHQFFKYAADYTLFRIAEFDDEKGQFVNESAWINLGNGSSMIRAAMKASRSISEEDVRFGDE